MREDKTGWLIIFDGTPNGEWGRELLPPREQKPNEVWSTPTRRKYTYTGKYAKATSLRRGDGESEGQYND